MNSVLPVDGSKPRQCALSWVAQLAARAGTPHHVVVWREAFIQAERRRLAAGGTAIAIQASDGHSHPGMTRGALLKEMPVGASAF